jgi:hypothetical protein
LVWYDNCGQDEVLALPQWDRHYGGVYPLEKAAVAQNAAREPPLIVIHEWELPALENPASTVTSVCIRFDQAELDALLAAYNPASGTSPSATECRPVVRAILDAIIAAEEG